jgi:peptidylprolyl isomerase
VTIVTMMATIRGVIVAMSAAIIAMSMATGAIAQDWRPLDPENTLVIDTTKGRMIVEMRPELAPKAVERIKLLARERVYDGLQFHRVIEGFVAQTGNPNNKDGGVSRHPDLESEFTFRLPLSPPQPCPTPPDDVLVGECISLLPLGRLMATLDLAAISGDQQEGFAGTLPVMGELAEHRSDTVYRGWGAYCTGVAGMGRQADPGSANSEIFFMLDPERRLDHDYTAWGRIVVGQDVLNALAVGEPPANPDRMTRVRVAAELPARERPRVEVEDGAALRARIDAARAAKGADFSVCDVAPVARVTAQ